MASRRAFFLLLALAASFPASAQDFAGAWSGWGKLTNDWPRLVCVYDGSTAPGSVKVELVRTGDKLGGTILLDIAPAAGSGCPPLRKQYLVTEARVSDAALVLLDSGGLEWNLAPRQEGAVLMGMLAWKGGGAPEALSAGFAVAGETPLVRLSGEVHLERPGAPKASAEKGAANKDVAPGETPAGGAASGTAASGAAAGAPARVTGGQRVGHFVAILGANVVAAGAIYGVNKLGQSTGSGSTTCSPRNCFIGAPGDPCLCNANVLAGASCGTVPGGVPQGGACDGTSRPCQSGFSCNGGICQDGSGACPY